MTPKNTICLWFDKDAVDAARFYAATFPYSEVTAVHEAPGKLRTAEHGWEDWTVFEPRYSRLMVNASPRVASAAA
jgi:predicted 3-demethylubiquinone-9 3-methyltransferase (glyoxalase superfamily)